MMLGLAFGEAKRSEDFGLRLQQKAQSPSVKTPPYPDHDEEEEEEGDECGEVTTKQKRTRRRRRSKKTPKETPTVATSAPALLTTKTSKKQHDAPMTKRDLYFCLRCGVVTVGKQGMDSAVGRITIVNWENQIVLSRFVKVPLTVTDYRTEITGITKQALSSASAIPFDQARKEVGKLIKGKILIGHGLELDLLALGLSHPLSDVRDTATYAPYMDRVSDGNNTTSLVPIDLASLARHALKKDVHGCPIQEAIACIDLYKTARLEWEAALISQAQQKERQRQLVMSMRAGSRVPSRNMVPAPLSAICEKEMVRSAPAPATFLPNRVYALAPPTTTVYDRNPMPPLHVRPSPPVFREEDNLSQASSGFFSQDTDMNSSFSSAARFDTGRTLEIENLNEMMSRTSIARTTLQPSSIPMAYSAAPSQENNSDWYLPRHEKAPHVLPTGLASTPSSVDVASDLWKSTSPSPPLPGAESWLHNSIDTSYPSYPHDSTAPLTEDELLQHLPSQLIADLDEDADMNDKSLLWPRSSAPETQQPSYTDAHFSSQSRTMSMGPHFGPAGGNGITPVKDRLPDKKQTSTWFRSLRTPKTPSSYWLSHSQQLGKATGHEESDAETHRTVECSTLYDERL